MRQVYIALRGRVQNHYQGCYCLENSQNKICNDQIHAREQYKLCCKRPVLKVCMYLTSKVRIKEDSVCQALL